MMSFGGGANIGGWTNASAPLATLSADRDLLTLQVLVLGTYQLRRDQVVRLEDRRGFLGLSRGIRIQHVHPDYPEKLTFYPSAPVPEVLARIQADGFIPTGVAPAVRVDRGIAFRWPLAALGIVLWNALFAVDLYRYGFNPLNLESHRKGMPVGWGAFTAMGLVLSSLAAVRWSEPCRRLFLKPGRSFEEIQHWVNLALLVLGLIFPAMLIFRFALFAK